MLILSENNKTLDTDKLTQEVHFSVLSFRDYKNPDFYFEKLGHLDMFHSASITLYIGPFTMVMPLHWSILCSDMENVEAMPLYDVTGRNYSVFCINPIDGYMPHYYRLKTGTIFPNTTWTMPPVADKDMLVVPLGTIQRSEDTVERGPLCAIFSPNKFEVNKPLSDIW